MSRLRAKKTRRKQRRSGARRRLRFGPPDASLTGCSGLAAVTALVDKLGLTTASDRHVGEVKQRKRGLSTGEFLLGSACAQLTGQATLSGLDRLRLDKAGEELAPAPFPAPRTAGRTAALFSEKDLAGVEAAVAEVVARWLGWLPAQKRCELSRRRPTIDLDATDVEVYGRKKRGVARTFDGKLAGRPHLASWAEAGLVLAGDLMSGDEDVRPRCVGLLRRALAALPAQVCAPPVVRADSGYFTGELAHAAVEAGCDFAIAAKRNPAFWRAYAAVPEEAWVPARDMHGAQVAAVDYAPAGWPGGSYTIVRRVKVTASEISADPRSRRRRTIPEDQLALALEGVADHAWAVNFVVTNLPADNGADVVGIEAWFRRRADVETRIKEAKLGAGLRHLPSADPAVNRVWTWAAILAGILSTMLQSLARIDTDKGRAHGDRLRHELLNVPARVTHHARDTVVRLPPGRHELLPAVLARLHALPAGP